MLHTPHCSSKPAQCLVLRQHRSSWTTPRWRCASLRASPQKHATSTPSHPWDVKGVSTKAPSLTRASPHDSKSTPHRPRQALFDRKGQNRYLADPTIQASLHDQENQKRQRVTPHRSGKPVRYIASCRRSRPPSRQAVTRIDNIPKELSLLYTPSRPSKPVRYNVSNTLCSKFRSGPELR